MLSENIYALRRKSGLSQEQLAEKIGVSRQAISKWEGGLSVPELDKLRALSEYFHVTIDELTGSRVPEDSGRPAPGRGRENRVGIFLCLTGAVCLALLGALTLRRPAAARQINGSSVIVIHGTGILAALFVLLMALGAVLIFRKK